MRHPIEGALWWSILNNSNKNTVVRKITSGFPITLVTEARVLHIGYVLRYILSEKGCKPLMIPSHIKKIDLLNSSCFPGPTNGLQSGPLSI